MVETTLEKLGEVPDNEMTLRCQTGPSETLGPLLPPIHPCTRDIVLCPTIVEVVCHCADGYKVGDKGFDVFVWFSLGAEQKLVARLPDPFLQNPDPFRRFRGVPKVKRRDRPQLRRRRVQNRVQDTNPVSIRI